MTSQINNIWLVDQLVKDNCWQGYQYAAFLFLSPMVIGWNSTDLTITFNIYSLTQFTTVTLVTFWCCWLTVGDNLRMLATEFISRWHFWMLVPDAYTVTNIFKLSPTHFVSNIRHQHRCSLELNMRGYHVSSWRRRVHRLMVRYHLNLETIKVNNIFECSWCKLYRSKCWIAKW